MLMNWKRDKGDEEAIDILEDKLKNKQNVAFVMKSIIDNNTKLLTGFNERYNKGYAKYYPEK